MGRGQQTPLAAFANNPAARNASRRRAESLNNNAEKRRVNNLHREILRNHPNLVQQAQAELNAQEQNGLTPIPPTPQPVSAASNRALAAAQVPLPANRNNILREQRKAAREQPNIWNMNQGRSLFQLGPERVVKPPILSPPVLSPPVQLTVQPVSFVQSASRRNRHRHNTTPGLARAQLRKREKLHAQLQRKAQLERNEAARKAAMLANNGLGNNPFNGINSSLFEQTKVRNTRRLENNAKRANRAKENLDAFVSPVGLYGNDAFVENIGSSQNQMSTPGVNAGVPAPESSPLPVPAPATNEFKAAAGTLAIELSHEVEFLRSRILQGALNSLGQETKNKVNNAVRSAESSVGRLIGESFSVNTQGDLDTFSKMIASVRTNLIQVHKLITPINSEYRKANKAAANAAKAERARLNALGVSGAVAAAQARKLARYASQNAAAAAAAAEAEATVKAATNKMAANIASCSPCEKRIIDKLDLLLTPSTSSQALTTIMKSVSAATKTAALAMKSAERELALKRVAMGAAGQEAVRQALNFAIDRYTAAIDAIKNLPPFPKKEEVLARLTAGRNAAGVAVQSVGGIIVLGVATAATAAYTAANGVYTFISTISIPKLPTLENIKTSWATTKANLERALGLKPDWWKGEQGLRARIGTRYQNFKKSLTNFRTGLGTRISGVGSRLSRGTRKVSNYLSGRAQQRAKILETASIISDTLSVNAQGFNNIVRRLVATGLTEEEANKALKAVLTGRSVTNALASTTPGMVIAAAKVEAAANPGTGFETVPLNGNGNIGSGSTSGANFGITRVIGGRKRSRKSSRKSSRKNRKSSRKNRKASRRNRK